jgi:hypothetical protein
MDAPKDLAENIAYRAWLWGRCEASHRFRAWVLERCAHDLTYYTDSFVTQYNPLRPNSEVGPFILRRRQEEALKATEARLFPSRPHHLRLDTIWEKSREEGASWMALILFDHRSLFHRRKTFICISHSEQAVFRSGDPSTLFWKISFMHEHLPPWITEGVEEFKLRFWFPKTKSAITGYASTVRSGVGGRGVVLLDEFGKMENADEILGQTASTGPRLIISTHYGTGTAFYRQTVRPDIHKEILHWTHNPEKSPGMYRFDPEVNRIEHLDKQYEFDQDYPFVRNPDSPGGPFRGLRSPWYDAEEVRVGSRRDMALHHDIHPEASGWQFFDDGLVSKLIRSSHVKPPIWEGDIDYNTDGMPVGLTRNPDGPLKLWILPKFGGVMPAGRYGMGCDIGAGMGATPSCLSVGDADLGMKVAEYARADLDPTAFAPIAAALGRLFRDPTGSEAFFAYERAGAVGAAFEKRLFELGYRNVYMRKSGLTRGGLEHATETPGWYPTPKDRMDLLIGYRAALKGSEWINPSEPSLAELRRFEYVAKGSDVRHAGEKSDNPAHGTINHGDQAIADALSWMATTQRGARRPIVEIARGPVPGGWLWRQERNLEADRMELTADD